MRRGLVAALLEEVAVVVCRHEVCLCTLVVAGAMLETRLVAVKDGTKSIGDGCLFGFRG